MRTRPVLLALLTVSSVSPAIADIADISNSASTRVTWRPDGGTIQQIVESNPGNGTDPLIASIGVEGVAGPNDPTIANADISHLFGTLDERDFVLAGAALNSITGMSDDGGNAPYYRSSSGFRLEFATDETIEVMINATVWTGLNAGVSTTSSIDFSDITSNDDGDFFFAERIRADDGQRTATVMYQAVLGPGTYRLDMNSSVQQGTIAHPFGATLFGTSGYSFSMGVRTVPTPPSVLAGAGCLLLVRRRR